MRNYISIIEEADTVQAPDDYNLTGKKSVFLAGSIDMGKAKDWQTEVEEALADLPVIILNPRRDDWDSSWEQDISNPEFEEQVEWEISGQDDADIICMYFDPDGQAPITLLELGLFAQSGKLIVCCPEGYWRRGNVQVVCNHYGILLVDTLEELIDLVKGALS